MKEEKESAQFELTDTRMSLNMQLSTVEQLENKLKLTKEAQEADNAAKTEEIDELKRTLVEMQNLTFMKDKHGENNALGDSEVQDGNELQDLPLE